jgi:hypothetical protein
LHQQRFCTARLALNIEFAWAWSRRVIGVVSGGRRPLFHVGCTTNSDRNITALVPVVKGQGTKSLRDN